MKNIIALFVLALSMTACFEPTYKPEDLIGKWQGDQIGFVFNEDGTGEYYFNGTKFPGDTRYRPVAIGNALEITADGKVIMSNLTIKSCKDNQLTLETRETIGSKELTSQTHVLNKIE